MDLGPTVVERTVDPMLFLAVWDFSRATGHSGHDLDKES